MEKPRELLDKIIEKALTNPSGTAGVLMIDADVYAKEREALRLAREGLLAAAAALNPHAPAMKEVVKGIEACDGVLGAKEAKR